MPFDVLVVDENDRPVRVAPSEEVWQKGLHHRIVRIMVEDVRGRILLQKRSPDMDLYPGRWDHSAAGHVDADEPYEAAAARETAEEIGLKNVKLEEIGRWRSHEVVDGRTLNRFNRMYRIRVDNPEFVVDEGEVSEIKWFTLDEAKNTIAKFPDTMTPDVIRVIKEHYR